MISQSEWLVMLPEPVEINNYKISFITNCAIIETIKLKLLFKKRVRFLRFAPFPIHDGKSDIYF